MSRKPIYKVGESVMIDNDIFIVKATTGIYSCNKCGFSEGDNKSSFVICMLPKPYLRKDGNGRCPLYGQCYFEKIDKGGV